MDSARLDEELGRASAMNLIARINKPEYLYQPHQLLRRLTRALRREPGEVDVVLPWGLRMRVRPREDRGRPLWHFGIYDLVLSEAIWRLLDCGETAIDVGANIGYVTGLMAARVGPTGSVKAFEPHPRVFTLLASNVERWRGQPIARATIHEMALSSNDGVGFLQEPENFQRNCGTSRWWRTTRNSGSVSRVLMTSVRNVGRWVFLSWTLKDTSDRCSWVAKRLYVPERCATLFSRNIVARLDQRFRPCS